MFYLFCFIAPREERKGGEGGGLLGPKGLSSSIPVRNGIRGGGVSGRMGSKTCLRKGKGKEQAGVEYPYSLPLL